MPVSENTSVRIRSNTGSFRARPSSTAVFVNIGNRVEGTGRLAVPYLLNSQVLLTVKTLYHKYKTLTSPFLEIHKSILCVGRYVRPYRLVADGCEYCWELEDAVGKVTRT